MSWGLFPDKYNDSVDFVYAAHDDKKNANDTWIGKIENFHIGYVHPPFFSKFEIQLLDFSLWNLFWWGHGPPMPLWAPLVNIFYFPLQRFYFTCKTIWFFWYIIFMDPHDPNQDDYTFGNWFYFLVLSGFLQDLVWPVIFLWSIIPIFNWLNFWWIELYFWIIAYPTREEDDKKDDQKDE